MKIAIMQAALIGAAATDFLDRIAGGKTGRPRLDLEIVETMLCGGVGRTSTSAQ